VPLTFGSLFSGVGGIDIGLERAGMVCKWQVEIDPYALRVLEKHWPGVKRYGDVRLIDWSQVEPVDLICGGVPCQPVSVAGKRLGKDDDRFLWPEVTRCLRDLRPRYALLENVPGLFSIDRGRVFGRILADLADCGYDAEYGILSAADMGAPHLRKRVFIIARRNDLWPV
jgi:DNA (cytosine-5)-methyltransferase 1